MVGSRSYLESIVQHNLVRHAGIDFATGIHYPLDVLVLINADVSRDLAWNQSCRGLNHLDEKSAIHRLRSRPLGHPQKGAMGVLRPSGLDL